MKILVTGGAGFVGSHACEAYLRAGHTVIAVDDLSTGERTNVNSDTPLHVMSVTDPAFAELVAHERPRVVNHHAAHSSVTAFVEDPENKLWTDVAGALRVYQACVAAGVEKVILASSGGGIYGANDPQPTPETTTPDPSTPYGISKLAVEGLLRFFARQHGFAYTILRYANVYGPRQRAGLEGGVVAIFAEYLRQGRAPTLFGARGRGDAGGIRDYVYAGDVAEANLLVLGNGDSAMVNIATGTGTTTRELYNLIAEHFPGAPQPIDAPPRAGDIPSSILDPSLAETTLDWRPRTTLREGIARTVAHCSKG